MLKNRYFRWSLKIISAVLSFSLIFLFIQPFFVPKYIGGSTTIVSGYSYLDKNSIDVLFLGSSQMFCTVDAGMLTDKYDISSYDFGASGQNLTMSEYYYTEALKTQSPNLVILETCQIFLSNDKIGDDALSWNFDPMNISIKKFTTAQQVCNNNIKAFNYSFTPLFLYHDRWNSIGDKDSGGENDIDYVIDPKKYIDLSSRGFLARDHVEPQKLAFYNDDTSLKTIPQESKTAILKIAEDCKNRNIKLVLFKSPSSSWTKGDSLSVKHFAEENSLEFIDLNEKLTEIGIDEKSDFYDGAHLNTNGAKKTTKYLAILLQSYLKN